MNTAIVLTAGFTWSGMLAPTLALGGLGLLFGVLLAVANRFFSVQADPKQLKIRENLPGANCGGCGFPGCDAFAKAVAEGKAPPMAARYPMRSRRRLWQRLWVWSRTMWNR